MGQFVLSQRQWPASRLWTRCKGLRGDRGSALIELAFIFAILGVPLLAGTAQMGLLVYDSIEVVNAAHAGALYGMQSLTYASNTSGIQTAARNDATDFGTALTVSSSTYYACSNAIGGTQYTGTNAQSNANTACTGSGNHALEFVQVNTSASVTPAIHWPGLPSSYTLRGTAVLEVEQ
jgi:Flp pilus assembly protein TadG